MIKDSKIIKFLLNCNYNVLSSEVDEKIEFFKNS